MKRNLLDSLRYVAFAVAAGIASLAAVSCDKENSKESPADVLKVTPSSVNFDGKQSSQTVEVNTKGLSWTATPKDSWVTVSPASGTGAATVTITVSENPNEADRFSSVTFSSENTVNVVVFQSAKVVEPEPEPKPEEPAKAQDKTMKFALATYLGDAFQSGGQCNVVILTLTDKEVSAEGQVELPYDDVSFVIALPPASDVNSAINNLIGKTYEGCNKGKVELNKYVYDFSSYSFVYGTAETDRYEYGMTGGKVIVGTTEDKQLKVDFEVTLAGDRTYKGTYTGTLSVADQSQSGGGEDASKWTSLTADYSPTVTTASAQVSELINDKGALVTKDCGIAYVSLEGNNSAGEKDILTLALYIDYSDVTGKDLSGTYPCAPADAKSYADLLNTFGPGEAEFQGNNVKLYPSILYSIKNGNKLTRFAVPEKGQVTLTKGEGNNYKIELALKDRLNHAISGTYNLSMPVTDLSTASVSSARALYTVKMANFTKPFNYVVLDNAPIVKALF